MLDVLITVSDDTPKAWVGQCRRSVAEAAACAGYPVNVIEVPGVPGHIGQAMVRGMVRGDAEYVAWVDDDDWVLPNAFSCLQAGFDKRPTAICARELQVLQNGHVTALRERHHLTAWRRDVLAASDLASNRAYPLVPLLESVKDTAVDVLAWVYVRRVRAGSGGAKLRGAS